MRPSEVLEKGGWTRGDYSNRGRHCMMGAIFDADEVEGVEDALVSYIHSEYRTSIVDWNDERCKSGKEAIAVMREVEDAVLGPRAIEPLPWPVEEAMQPSAPVKEMEHAT